MPVFHQKVTAYIASLPSTPPLFIYKGAVNPLQLLLPGNQVSLSVFFA